MHPYLIALAEVTSLGLLGLRDGSDLTRVRRLMTAFSISSLVLSFFSRSGISPLRVSLVACLLVAATAGGCGSHGAARNDAASDSGTGDGGVWPCAPPADPTQPFPTLAATGCMDDVAVTRFAAGAHGYEVNSP